MDPNAALAEIRQITQEFYRCESSVNAVQFTDRIVELTQSLDDWLSNGGFLPKPWAEARSAEHWQHVLSSTNARAYKRGYEDGQFDKTDGSI